MFSIIVFPLKLWHTIWHKGHKPELKLPGKNGKKQKLLKGKQYEN